MEIVGRCSNINNLPITFLNLLSKSWVHLRDNVRIVITHLQLKFSNERETNTKSGENLNGKYRSYNIPEGNVPIFHWNVQDPDHHIHEEVKLLDQFDGAIWLPHCL